MPLSYLMSTTIGYIVHGLALFDFTAMVLLLRPIKLGPRREGTSVFVCVFPSRAVSHTHAHTHAQPFVDKRTLTMRMMPRRREGLAERVRLYYSIPSQRR